MEEQILTSIDTVVDLNTLQNCQNFIIKFYYLRIFFFPKLMTEFYKIERLADKKDHGGLNNLVELQTSN